MFVRVYARMYVCTYIFMSIYQVTVYHVFFRIRYGVTAEADYQGFLVVGAAVGTVALAAVGFVIVRRGKTNQIQTDQ